MDTAGQVDRFMRRLERRQAGRGGGTPVTIPAEERPTVAEAESQEQ